MPALLNRMSSPPQESTCEIMAATEDSLETSVTMVSRRPGWEGRRVESLETAVVRAGCEMSAIRTEAPSRRKRWVVSKPIPLGRERQSAECLGRDSV